MSWIALEFDFEIIVVAMLQVKIKGKTDEGEIDPVTEGDMYSHKEMYYGLMKMWPDLKIVSEENSKKDPNPSDIKPINLNTEEIEQKLGMYRLMINFVDDFENSPLELYRASQFMSVFVDQLSALFF